jgi:hypothetical protein
MSILTLRALCGPAAPACAVVGGVAAAVMFELAFNEADEAFSRPAAKSDLKIAMKHMTLEARDAYLETYDAAIDEAIARTFRPYVPSDN